MKRNFYLQHPLMAMNDPEMQNLLNEEGLKGVGAYWVIIEKLALLPEPCAQLDYLRPFCKGLKISFAYLKKIILNYPLFIMEEDGYFTPAELNPVRGRNKKRAEETQKADVNAWENEQKVSENTSKNEQKTQKNEQKTRENARKSIKNERKTSKNESKIAFIYSHKTLKHCNINENPEAIKENIRDIITTATTKEKEKTAAVADVIAVNEIISGSSAIASGGSVSASGETDTVTCKFIPPQPWRELVDSLSSDSEWVEIVCMKSGYGGLLRQYFNEAVEIFKQHVVLYDKGDDLLSMRQVHQYFANFVSAEKTTSTALREKLRELDIGRKAKADELYRYEKRIDGKRTYMGCLIPDCAPPRPDDSALWNNLTMQWVSIPQRKSLQT
ncbi:hypothetical protein [Bacteroides sp. UBA939]|uniref:DUF7833 domain-containing protein n=1 Tax=Bacteroides sp. UBA939 TaxID=1946092 RepID=UPI0025B8C497|nr:hypothetical protein [Bacteroides sp. UBA939]